jgi:hypothetical protein
MTFQKVEAQEITCVIFSLQKLIIWSKIPKHPQNHLTISTPSQGIFKDKEAHKN